MFGQLVTLVTMSGPQLGSWSLTPRSPQGLNVFGDFSALDFVGNDSVSRKRQ